MNAPAPAQTHPQVDGRFGRPLGGRHARRRHDELQRRPDPLRRRVAPGRTLMMVESIGAEEQDRLNGPGKDLHVIERFTRVGEKRAALPLHDRGSGNLGAAMDGRIHLAGNRSSGFTSTRVTKRTTRWRTFCGAPGSVTRRRRNEVGARYLDQETSHADEIADRCVGRAGAHGCRSRHGTSCIRRRVRLRTRPVLLKGQGREGRVGKSPRVDPYGGRRNQTVAPKCG